MKKIALTCALALFACDDDDGGKPLAQSDSAVNEGPSLPDGGAPEAGPLDASRPNVLDAALGEPSDAAGSSPDAGPADTSIDGSIAMNGSDASASKLIGAAGGSFGNSALTVTVPAGALSAELDFSVQAATSGAPNAMGGTWELGPTGTAFATPALLTFHAGAIASGIGLDELAIVTSTASGWTLLEGLVRDESAKTVSAPLAHLSPYALVQQPKPVACPDAACANGVCALSATDWSCSCNVGFQLDAATKTCTNIDDCPATACEHGTCVDGLSDYSCTCETGYDYDPQSKTCLAHDDCKPEYCVGGSCVDGVNDYTCMGCPFEGSGTKSCTGMDDCVGKSCTNGVCVDGDDDYSCMCNQGFDGSGSKTCTPHDDCPAGACSNGKCVDLQQDYKCECDPGFDLDGAKACKKHLYCSGNPCGAGGSCVEQPTGYTCNCAAPFVLQGGTCIDRCAGVACGLGGTCDAATGRCSCPTSDALHIVASSDGKTCQCGRSPIQGQAGTFLVYADCNGDPSDGCEANLNSQGACGFCSDCTTPGTWELPYPITVEPNPTPIGGTQWYVYRVAVPTCPARIKAGEICGSLSQSQANATIGWSDTDCVAGASGPPRCIPRPSN